MRTSASADSLLDDVAAAVGGDASRDRLLHARGVLATGRFTPTAESGELSAAALFAGPSVPVTARFSSTLGGHDGEPGDQGLAVRFHVGPGQDMDLLAFTLPVFFVRNAPDMLEFLRATNSGDPAAVSEFAAHHPEAATAMALAEEARPADSFTGVTYHAVHTFGLVGENGRLRWARLGWEPWWPLEPLSREEALARPADYLTRGLAGRLPSGFRLVARFPGADDLGVLHDPTRVWSTSADRSVDLGELMLDAVGVGVTPRFDPLRLLRGFEAPRDELVGVRSGVYGVGWGRR
ncbi:catalase [Streptomyces olivoreticuli]|uniref:catalase n=1 Tax=Streptomyces olivoreticuli TaxID=68246 RepID=UPI000E27CDB9|nr:catalase [Streptomyces olivoreticuli]